MLELTRPELPDGPLCAELRGVVDVEILRRTLKTLATRCAREETERIILDLRDVESRCSLIDLRSLGDELARLGFQPTWRLAVVGGPTQTDLALFETICLGHGAKVRCFRDCDAARCWLRSGD